MADPGFPVGGVDPLGGMDPRRRHFLAKMYVKMKELDPVGGGDVRPERPLDPPMEPFLDMSETKVITPAGKATG